MPAGPFSSGLPAVAMSICKRLLRYAGMCLLSFWELFASLKYIFILSKAIYILIYLISFCCKR